ncbi:MAG: hypothetical protein LBN95_11410 [Prevotellaceae bacterium]|jgi:hypothetical protein|nr:hypothetical protein [Prevotellaceae bacterium]
MSYNTVGKLCDNERQGTREAVRAGKIKNLPKKDGSKAKIKMDKFEYKVKKFGCCTDLERERELNWLGSEGWELICLTYIGEYLFKRKKQW